MNDFIGYSFALSKHQFLLLKPSLYWQSHPFVKACNVYINFSKIIGFFYGYNN